MRCPDCNKFVSYDADQDPEVDVSVSEDGDVSGSCRIVNCCADCGTELKEANLEVEYDFTEEVAKHRAEKPDEKHSFEVSSEGSRTERVQTHDRHGKAIKSARYRKTFYGAEVTAGAVLQLQRWDARDRRVGGGEEQAGAMEELI